eukprot:TRINITY_DN28_c0_g2_i2.p1 TRINITY_DN28_c0_g2~~TRINITY_DN28_c0_g2_i2.p1  ORF type:complete len:368 (+),score=90.71 TRINITY_DN28_c0_g2_i2:127-1230(+)
MGIIPSKSGMNQDLLYTSVGNSGYSRKKLAAIALVGVVACVGLICLFNARVEAAPSNLVITGYESWIVSAFHKWTAKHNKVYVSFQESAYRLRVFRDNVLKIKAITDEGRPYTLAINKFADLTQEEFASRYLGYKAPTRERNFVTLNTTNIPDSIDWRQKNAVNPVKDQGMCGSCWAFSTTGSVEGIVAITKGTLLSFSEQQLVDCSGSYGNEGCNGGLMDQAFQYIIDNGIEQENDYPYKGTDQKCKYDASKADHTVKGYTDVPENDEDQLTAAIANQPVSVAIEADRMVFQFYSGGIIDSKSCGTDLDHGVLAVGYGAESGKNYYIVKNSWGGDWGEKGYVRIGRHGGKGPGICGIAEMASYPTA